jgi:hypothetical protein
MDDIDRTFARLKRTDYTTLVSEIKNGPMVNPYTFKIEYTKWCEPICIDNGWTLEELNNELNKKLHDYK